MARKKASAKAENIKRCTVEVKHSFTTEEWRDRTDEHLSLLQQKEVKQEAKDAASAVFKADIKDLEARARDVAAALRNGYELRKVEATVEFNKKKGIKSFYYCSPGNPENKKLIRQEPMTQDDYQLLPLDDVKLETQPPLENAAAELQDSLQRRQVAEDGEPVRVRSEDEKE